MSASLSSFDVAKDLYAKLRKAGANSTDEDGGGTAIHYCEFSILRRNRDGNFEYDIRIHDGNEIYITTDKDTKEYIVSEFEKYLTNLEKASASYSSADEAKAVGGSGGEDAASLKKTRLHFVEDESAKIEFEKLAKSASDRSHFFEIIKLAIAQTINDYGAVDSVSFLEECYCRNFFEYLEYLKEIPYVAPATWKITDQNLLEEEEVRELIDMVGDPEILSSPAFFTSFLLKFKACRASWACLLDDMRTAGFVPYNFKNYTPPLDSQDLARQLIIENTDVHCSEAKGLRPRQEDAFFVGTLSPAFSSNAKDMPNNLQKMFVKFGGLEPIRNSVAGSTALVACATPDGKLTLANLGDSRAVLFVRDKKSGAITFQRLTHDSDPADAYERSLVIKNGGYLDKDAYVGGPGGTRLLSMTKAFGDREVGAGNLIDCCPDMHQYNLKREEDQEYFLYLSCDGAFEGGVCETNYAAAMEEWYKDKALQEKWPNLSTYLRDYALALGSQDNVTVLLADITKVPKAPLVAGVFDGHFDASVSATAAHYLGNQLLNKEKAYMIQSPLSQVKDCFGNDIVSEEKSDMVAEIGPVVESPFAQTVVSNTAVQAVLAGK